MRYLNSCIVMTLIVAFAGCTGGSSENRASGPPPAEVAREPSERLVTEMLATSATTPSATPELLTPTPAPDPEIYIESGQLFFETWRGETVMQPPPEVGSQVAEEPRLEDAVETWRDFFEGTRVLAQGIIYDLCRDGTALYVSGAPGMWPDGTTLTYRLLPYKRDTGFDFSHIELQISPDQPELLFFRRKYQAYHFANVDGFIAGFFFGSTMIDAPVIKSPVC